MKLSNTETVFGTKGNQMMKRTFRVGAGALIAAGSLGVGAPALAQDVVLEEILVTARKTEESLNDAPITVTAFTENAIDTLDINSINDIARFSPGLSFSSAFGRATERPVIRGQGNILAGVQFGVESGVAYFVDGMYYSGDIQSLDFTSLQRVEVIKGPQSALYGRNTYSGAVNFITNGAPEEFEAEVQIEALQDGEERVNIMAGGTLIDDTLRARINFRSYDFDGQWTNRLTGGDVGGENSKSAQVQFDWTPTDQLSVRLRGSRLEDEDETRPFFLQSATQNNCFSGFRSLALWPLVDSTNPNQYFCGEIQEGPVLLNDGPDADGQANVIPGLNPDSTFPFVGALYNLNPGVAFSGVEREVDNWGLGINYDFDSGYQIVVNATYYSEERITGSDSDHGPINLILPFTPNAEAFFAISGINDLKDNSFEVRVNSPADNRFRWTLGGFYYDFENDATDITFTGQTDNGTDNEIQNQALFGSISYDVTDTLTVSLEARYAEEEKSQQTLDAASVETFSGDATFYAFTPRFTADWQISEDTLLYAVYSEGNKPGGLNGPDGVEVFSPTYEEEESKNYEIGIKQSLFGGRGNASIAAFFVDIDKYQLTTPLPDPTGALNSIVTNQGDGEVLGVEVELNYALSENMTAGLTYALADSEFTNGCDEFQWSLTSGGGLFTGDEATSLNPNGQGDCSIEGNQFPMSSKHQASAFFDWGFPIGASGMQFVGNINLSYESKRYTQVHQLAYAGAATLVGARIGVTGENWEAMFIGRNLTDEDSIILATRWLQVPYINNFTSVNVAPAGADQGIPRAFFALPRRQRQMGVEFTYRF